MLRQFVCSTSMYDSRTNSKNHLSRTAGSCTDRGTYPCISYAKSDDNCSVVCVSSSFVCTTVSVSYERGRPTSIDSIVVG